MKQIFLLLICLLMAGCAGMNGEAQATHDGGYARSSVFKVGFP